MLDEEVGAHMYEHGAPARDIREVLEYLASEHRPGDLYRGQTKEYPAILPSRIRSVIRPETAGDPIVLIGSIPARSPREAARERLFHHLLKELGWGLGDVVAQQYLVFSECVDVTADPQVAAYFATRRYPYYAHIEGPGCGVIYRFRRPPFDHTHLSSLGLGRHFDMGEALDAGVFFDHVREESEAHGGGMFDRDFWNWSQSGVEAVVATMPLAFSWSDLLPCWEATHADRPLAFQVDATSTRWSHQSGGFLRPRFHWTCLIPPSYRVEVPSGTPDRIKRALRDSLPWPRAVPSLAVKKTLVGVENLRLRPGTMAFHFKHGQARIARFYRRDLWPEPSEDHLFGEIWRRSVLLAADYLRNAKSVDDPEDGLLDRGYLVGDDVREPDGRAGADLFRAQLQDAAEIIKEGLPTLDDYDRRVNALLELGHVPQAGDAAAEMTARFPEEARAWIVRGTVALESDDLETAGTSTERAYRIDPQNVQALFLGAKYHAVIQARDSALHLLELAIRHHDGVSDDPSPSSLQSGRAFLAAALDRTDVVRDALKQFAALGGDAKQLRKEIDARMREEQGEH